MPSGQTEPLLSIIMPVYNAEKYVAQAIQSIIDQTYQNWELFVIDDASKDRSLQEIEKFDGLDNRIKVLRNKENKGKVKSVNSTVNHCKGKYLTIHDADDWSGPNRFEIQIKYLEISDTVLCGTAFNTVGERGEFLGQTDLQTNYIDIKKKITTHSQFHGPTVVFKKGIINIVGGLYRDPFIVAEDIDFCERVTERFPTSNIPQALYNYRLHSESITKKKTLYSPERYALKDLIVYLRNERRISGKDSLWDNKLSPEISMKYSSWVLEWKSKYSVIYKDGIQRSVYFGFTKLAFSLSFEWIRKTPFSFVAWKNLLSLSLLELKKKAYR